MAINYSKIDYNAVTPKEEGGGYTLFLPRGEYVEVLPLEYALVETGIALEILEDYASFIINPGEGLMGGLEIVNSPIFVKPEDGRVEFVVRNTTNELIILYPGTKVASICYAQMHFQHVQLEEY